MKLRPKISRHATSDLAALFFLVVLSGSPRAGECTTAVVSGSAGSRPDVLRLLPIWQRDIVGIQ